MPYKDPAKQKIQRREHYLAHKEDYLRRSKERRIRLQKEAFMKKALQALLPKAIEPKSCIDCGIDITESYKPKHGTRCSSCKLQKDRDYRAANKERIAAQKKAWVEANKKYKAEQDRLYALQNPQARRQARDKWAKENHGKNNSLKALNKISRKKRTPKWLTEDDFWMIEQAYELAAMRTKMFGFMWHVDHIIPLHGKTVSGLHVPTNLQVIPAIENLQKGNRV